MEQSHWFKTWRVPASPQSGPSIKWPLLLMLNPSHSVIEVGVGLLWLTVEGGGSNLRDATNCMDHVFEVFEDQRQEDLRTAMFGAYIVGVSQAQHFPHSQM